MVAQTAPRYLVPGVGTEAPGPAWCSNQLTTVKPRRRPDWPGRHHGLGLDDRPSASTKLTGELLGGQAAHRLVLGRSSPPWLSDRSIPVRLGLQELVDEGRRFVASELASGLALGEPHGAPCIAEVRMAGVVEEGQQLTYLPG